MEVKVLNAADIILLYVLPLRHKQEIIMFIDLELLIPGIACQASGGSLRASIAVARSMEDCSQS